MKVDHVPCGDSANESERIAVERLKAEVGRVTGAGRWLLLSNVPHAVTTQAVPAEVDIIAIGPSGLHVIEVKHWDRSYVKEFQATVLQPLSKVTLRGEVRPDFGRGCAAIDGVPALIGYGGRRKPFGDDEQAMEKLTGYVITAEQADILCVAQNTVRKWAAQSKIPMYRNPANGYRLFRRSDLKTFLNRVKRRAN